MGEMNSKYQQQSKVNQAIVNVEKKFFKLVINQTVVYKTLVINCLHTIDGSMRVY
jgi:hypothetical protein